MLTGDDEEVHRSSIARFDEIRRSTRRSAERVSGKLHAECDLKFLVRPLRIFSKPLDELTGEDLVFLIANRIANRVRESATLEFKKEMYGRGGHP